MERRFTNVVFALRRVSGSSSSALSRAALSAPIAPKAVFALLTRSARSSRRSAIAVTAVEVSVTKRSRTFWSSASSRVRSLVLTRNGLKYLVASEACSPLPSYWSPKPRMTFRRPFRVLRVERVEERVDVHRRGRVVGADLPAVVDLAVVVRSRLERHVAIRDPGQRGGADRGGGALVQAAEVVVHLQRDHGLGVDRRARPCRRCRSCLRRPARGCRARAGRRCRRRP